MSPVPGAAVSDRTVVFIHGLWVTAESWDGFRRPWEAAGWTVLTPTWSVLADRTASCLNADPPADLGGLSIGEIVDELETYIRALPSPPLLLGHSFGGLFVQLLLDRGVGRAGIAINPAPIGGVIHGWLTLTAALPPILRWKGWSRPYALSRRRWADRFANSAPKALQAESYDTYVIPTSGRVFHQAAVWAGTRVRPRLRTQPLLITAGEADRLVTPYVSRAAWRIQKRAPGRTDYRMFLDRSHLLLAEPGWEEVAAVLIRWAEAYGRPEISGLDGSSVRWPGPDMCPERRQPTG